MSNNNTPTIDLYKYDPVVDADATFNITTGLNNNWDKIDTFGKSIDEKTIKRTTAPITYYIRPDGNDNNDGSANTADKAFRTITKAIDTLPKHLEHDVTINISPSSYNETIRVKGFSGSGNLKLVGGTSYADSLNFIVKNLLTYRNSCRVYVQGLTFNATTDPAVNSLSDALVYVRNCRASASTTQWGYVANEGSNLYVVECEVSNKQIGIVAQGSFVLSYANSGTGNTTALYAFDGGRLAAELGQPTGTVLQQNQASGGIITQASLGVSVWGGWKRHASLLMLGLDGATVTTTALHSALGNLSEVVFTIANANSLGLPQGYWQVTATRMAYNLTTFRAVGDVGTAYSGHVLEGTYNGDVGFSGWISNGTQIGDVIYYVRPDGNDLNDGFENSASRAFKTIAGAIKMIPRTVNGYITIRVADGVYNERIALFSYTGAGTISIQGNTSSAGNVQITDIIVVGCITSVIIAGFKCTRTTNSAVEIYRSLCVGLSNLEITTSASWIGIYAEFSKVRASGCVISNRNNAAIQCHMNGEILIENCSGSNNATGIYATYGAKISKAGTVPLGTTPEAAIYGGIITGDEYLLQISNGLAAGWSGTVTIRKSFDNLVELQLYITKSSDIVTYGETVLTIPAGFRPITGSGHCVITVNSGGGPVLGGFAELFIGTNGVINIANTSNVVGARSILNGKVMYYSA